MSKQDTFFDYTKNTRVTIDGAERLIRFAKGMTGIGSRVYWLDDIKQTNDAVRCSDDIESGNHYLYSMRWRDLPWDRVDILISEESLPQLLNEDNAWRKPIKKNV